MIQRVSVTLSEDAILDLESIGSFIMENGGSEGVALNFIDRIKDRCQRIGDAPRAGRPRDDLSPGLRTVPFEHSAVIAYVVTDERILILDIFYGGRDFEALLRDGDGSSEA